MKLLNRLNWQRQSKSRKRNHFYTFKKFKITLRQLQNKYSKEKYFSRVFMKKQKLLKNK